MKKLIMTVVSFGIIAAMCGCNRLSGISISAVDESTDNNIEMKLVEATAEPLPAERVVTVSAVGDCTLATDVNAKGSKSFEAAAEEHSGDYSYFLSDAKKYFENDDLTIVNFEGTLSERGKRQSKQFAFRGKPDP